MAEPDGLLLPSDIDKLFIYSDDSEVVFGTRTTRELIWEGANMAFFLKWGNWAVAKMIELLFNTTHLSDVGCTYRVLHKERADHVAQNMPVAGAHAGIEIMLLTVVSGARFVEVPVNYLPRVGASSVTGDLWKAWVLGCQMIALILRFRFTTFGQVRRAPPQPEPTLTEREAN